MPPHTRPALAALLLLAACRAGTPQSGPPPGPLDQLDRDEFNFRAAEHFLPLFWRADDNANHVLEPAELAVLWGPQKARRADYVDDRGFTPAFLAAYQSLLGAPDLSALTSEEKTRRELVLRELRGGRPTLVETDLSKASAEDRAVIDHVMAAAVIVERLFARQMGTVELQSEVPAGDAASRALFHRNQGPWCVTPQLQDNPQCSALASHPPQRSGLYPADLQADKGFCDMLAKQPNAAALMDHFSTVERDGAGWKAVPYHVAYKEDMQAVAGELEAAAAALTSPDEASFKAYLTAAATAFRTNEWEPANEAWLKMGGSPSRFYLRVAPDEVYYEPCAWKAGFFVSFAYINPDSKQWRDKLTPIRADMEKAMAQLAGPPYKARDVNFKLPDFIDIIVNAGDGRDPHGATIGQSLPNWGPVADKGGRTVAMTNFYTDADSRTQLARQMASIFCAATNKRATTDPRPGTMSTVLHEAAHNLGPSHDYAVDGKKDRVVFGGPLASVLEELKAQTSAIWLPDWLVKRGLLTQAEADEAHVRDVAWAMNHISRGMYEGDGKPKTYSQVGALQLGALWKAGVLNWRDGETSAGGDSGCFEIDLGKWAPAVEQLEARVLRIKGRGDKADAEAMKAAFVDGKDEWARLRSVLSERWLRAPKATFYYSVR